MKNMKSVFVIVFVVVALLTVGAVTYQAMVVAPRAAEQKNILKQYNFPGNEKTNKAPSNGFPVNGAGSTVQSGDPEINDMLQTLDQTSDDGGTSDIQLLETDVVGL